MRFATMISLFLMLSGAALVITSVAAGETDVSLVVVFPVLSGSGAYFLIGVGMIVASILIWFLTVWIGAIGATAPSEIGPAEKRLGEGSSAKLKYGGVILLGPVPIAFGSSSKVAYAMLGVGVAVIVILLGLILLALL